MRLKCRTHDVTGAARNSGKATLQTYIDDSPSVNGLRLGFHVNHANDAISRRILAAEEEFVNTCEICDQPGKLREDTWIKTVCDEHASGQEMEDRG
jgi:hypothetical protein